MLNLALLGCGRIGQVHARSISQLADKARLVAVADAYEPAAQELAAASGAEVRNSAQIMQSDDVDAIIIGTPTDTHYQLIHDAAAAGKAIFCEKPIDMSAERIRDCIVAVKKANVAFLAALTAGLIQIFPIFRPVLPLVKLAMSSLLRSCHGTPPRPRSATLNLRAVFFAI